MMIRFVILVLALSSGGLAALLMFKETDVLETIADVSEPVADVRVSEVLVAASELSQGDVLTASSFYWAQWPENAVNGAFIVRSERPEAASDLAGKFVRGSFAAGEPIRAERVSDADARLLSSALPAGRRAVALRVSAESTAGGFVLPNDRVDVVLTEIASSDEGGSTVSRIIARNVRVLAIDQLVSSADAESLIGSTATLELSEQQVGVVLAAAASGVLSLALRSAADHDLIEAEPEVFAPQPSSMSREPAPLAVSPPRTVRVRRGMEVEIEALD